MVKNIQDLKNIDSKNSILIIANIGLRKKLELLKKIKELKFNVSNIKNIDQRILTSIKRFVWITGVYGTGKTYSLYAIRNNEILNKGNSYFEIQIEADLNYDINYRKIARLMASPRIFFDARNYFADFKNSIQEAGIKYSSVALLDGFRTVRKPKICKNKSNVS